MYKQKILWISSLTQIAKWITSTAKMPLRLILLVITIALAWFFSGWVASILSMISFGGSFALGDFLLKPWIARPRPDSDLVNVVGSPSGFSMPSTFGIIYASTLGFILLLVLVNKKRSASARVSIGALCSLLLLVGFGARVTLGAHWPSDVIVAYLIAGMWGLFLIEIVLPHLNQMLAPKQNDLASQEAEQSKEKIKF